MKTIGFPISHKENEKRRALVPADLAKIAHADRLYFEQGYGAVLGCTDEDYRKYGSHIVSREQALAQSIVCDPKIGDADYLPALKGQTVFGWLHAVQNRPITDALVNGRLTAYAWEDMFAGGRHVFWRNNEIAGEAAIFHAFTCHGRMPYQTKAALIGRGNVAAGALKILTLLGADVTVYNRRTEALLRQELPRFDVVVNAVLWDTARKDHILYKEDLARMKPGALIIDVSCDRAGAIETSVPTTLEEPSYCVDGITHYVVDHTPSLFYKTASEEISAACWMYLDRLICDTPDAVLAQANCVKDGRILDARILAFQNRSEDTVK